MGLAVRIKLPMVFANNKGANQPAHPHSSISAFVNRLLKNIIPELVSCQISII